jgi:hypothetical protein
LVNIKKSIPILQGYQSIEQYLDHDEAGRRATQHIMHQFPGARDDSDFFCYFKDLNEYHLKKVKACLPQAGEKNKGRRKIINQ